MADIPPGITGKVLFFRYRDDEQSERYPLPYQEEQQYFSKLRQDGTFLTKQGTIIGRNILT
jgi:hypothetical protein